MTVATVFGSYLVLRAFHKFHSLRTVSNVVLVSLSTADDLLAIPLIFGIVQMSLRLLNGSDGECSSGPLGKITSTSSFFLISVIILHLALISVERLIAVKCALRYHTIVTNPRALIVALAMSFFAATVRGGSRIFFRRGYTRLLLYFNTNKQHSFFFLQNTSCIRKPHVIFFGGAGGGWAPLHPPPRSAPDRYDNFCNDNCSKQWRH